jgi:hypothetical protein
MAVTRQLVAELVSAILGKLDLEADASVHRRVAAVLTFLRESEGRR